MNEDICRALMIIIILTYRRFGLNIYLFIFICIIFLIHPIFGILGQLFLFSCALAVETQNSHLCPSRARQGQARTAGSKTSRHQGGKISDFFCHHWTSAKVKSKPWGHQRSWSSLPVAAEIKFISVLAQRTVTERQSKVDLRGHRWGMLPLTKRLRSWRCWSWRKLQQTQF